MKNDKILYLHTKKTTNSLDIPVSLYVPGFMYMTLFGICHLLLFIELTFCVSYLFLLFIYLFFVFVLFCFFINIIPRLYITPLCKKLIFSVRKNAEANGYY